MNNIIRHIEYLISRNDCVIIPGFGALLARYEASCIDFDARKIMPPKRVFSFNPDLRHNDGTLICSVARSKQIPYSEAESLVTAQVEEMMHQLYSHGETPLGKVGLLLHDTHNGTTTFAPAVRDHLSAATMWLEKIEAEPIAVEEEKTPTTPVAPVKIKKAYWHKAAAIAAGVALLITVGIFASNSLLIKHTMKASLAPEINSEQAEAESIDAADPAAGILYITSTPIVEENNNADIASQSDSALKKENSSLVTKGAQETAKSDVQQARPAVPQFYLIVGSFRSTDEARCFIDMHKADNLKILNSDGKVRVYASVHNSRQDASKSRAAFANKYNGAWIYSTEK